GVLFIYRFAATGAPLALWLGLGLSYASMHSLGVGLVFSLAALATAALVLVQRGITRSTGLSWTIFLTLTVIHATVMSADATSITMSIPAQAMLYIQTFGALLVGSLQAMIASFTYPLPGDRSDFLLPGAALLMACAIVAIFELVKAMRRRN